MRIEVKGRNLQVTDELKDVRCAEDGQDRQAGFELAVLEVEPPTCARRPTP
jgi:hypothetical protein